MLIRKTVDDFRVMTVFHENVYDKIMENGNFPPEEGVHMVLICPWYKTCWAWM